MQITLSVGEQFSAALDWEVARRNAEAQAQAPQPADVDTESGINTETKHWTREELTQELLNAVLQSLHTAYVNNHMQAIHAAISNNPAMLESIKTAIRL